MEWLCHFCYCKCNCLAVIHVMTVETSFPKGDIHVRSFLTLSRRRPLLYRNQGIDLQSKSIDWFLYDNGLRLERVKVNYFAADKSKSLICRVFMKIEMILFCVYAEFHIIYFQMVFYTVF